MTAALSILFVIGIVCAYLAGYYSGKAEVYGQWGEQTQEDLHRAIQMAEDIREWEKQMGEKE